MLDDFNNHKRNIKSKINITIEEDNIKTLNNENLKLIETFKSNQINLSNNYNKNLNEYLNNENEARNQNINSNINSNSNFIQRK